jgi:hypothetical protein
LVFSLSPIVLAILIIGVVAVIGIALNGSRRDATFAGYEDLANDLKRIRRRLRGQLRRDGKDIVIDGEWRNLPVHLRLSHREDAPGVHLRIPARATFALEIVPRRSPVQSRRPVVQIPDISLESRYVLRSDSPAEARLFATMSKVPQSLQVICASSRTSVAIEKGAVEVAEPALPQHYLAQRLLRQIAAVAELAIAFESMPHSDLLRVPTVRRERGILGRVALVAGVVMTVAAVASASYETRTTAEPAVQAHAPEGISLADAVHISNLWRWTLAQEADFDPAAVRWLHDRNQNALGKINLDMSGSGTSAVAYSLMRENPRAMRVVVLEGGDVRYDVTYSSVAAMIRVPAQALSQVEWTSAPSAQPDGDALLLIMHLDDPGSGLLLYSHAGRVLSAAPADFQRIPLE